jgi:aspartate carbamoyltransferase catalytic subunit
MAMNLLSINDITKENILKLFAQADSYRLGPQVEAPLNTAMSFGLLFFEPSTRTRIGFETANWKLGYRSILLDETKPSRSKGWAESMPDTIRTLNAYVDAYFIRHSDSEVFSSVLPYTDKPVINCGNGYDEHPTQALIDAYAIWVKFGRLDGLTITFVGDTRYSRSAHSLALLLSKFLKVNINEITPNGLSLPTVYLGVNNKSTPTRISKAELGHEDILYSAGFSPINPSGTFSQDTVQKYVIHKKDAERLKNGCVIMNPLPRIDEIDYDVDDSPKAYYFEQNELGLYMRMAIAERYCLN